MRPERSHRILVSLRELDTVVTALVYWSVHLDTAKPRQRTAMMALASRGRKPLTSKQVVKLARRIKPKRSRRATYDTME